MIVNQLNFRFHLDFILEIRNVGATLNKSFTDSFGKRLPEHERQPLDLQLCLIMTFPGFLSCHQKYISLPFSGSWNSALLKFSVYFLPLRVDELWTFPLEWEMALPVLPVIMWAPPLSGWLLCAWSGAPFLILPVENVGTLSNWLIPFRFKHCWNI